MQIYVHFSEVQNRFFLYINIINYNSEGFVCFFQPANVRNYWFEFFLLNSPFIDEGSRLYNITLLQIEVKH